MELPADAVQVVIASKLSNPDQRQEFLRLSALTEAWLRQQPGFLRYELYETADGWFDAMLWRDDATADSGTAAFAETNIAQGFAAIIQPNYRVLRGHVRTLG